MSSRLLTLMRKRGAAFNPLSLNPTLWALPSNSFSRTGAQFTAASSQYLSLTSNSDVQTGDVDFWVAFWFYADSLGTYVLVAKDTNTSREYTILTESNGSNLRVQFFLGSGGSSIVNSAYSISTGSWNFVLAGYSAVDDLLYVVLNGVRSAGAATVPAGVGAAEFRIGARAFPGSENYHNGRIDNVLLGKPPTALGDGTEGSLAYEIATALYGSNNGLAFQSITAQQESDWGIVSGWLDNSLTADAFGSNTLTNNNSVTQAAGKVNAVAVDNDPTYFVDDASENNNDPIQTVLANRPLYDVDAFGSGRHGWYVDGSNDYFSLPLTFPSVFSVSVWVKTGFAYNSAAQTYNILSFGGTGQFTLRYEGRSATLGVTDAFAVVLNSDSVDYPLASGSLSFTSGTQYHLTVTCDYTDDEYAFYVNGVEVDTSTDAQTLPTGSNKKFGEFYSGGFGWLGHLGPLVITSDILTASEILALYNRGPQ